MLYVIGMGPGPEEDLTPRALRLLMQADRVYLRTSRHRAARSLMEARQAETLDDLFDAAEDFDELNEAIAEKLLSCAAEETVAYGVPGMGMNREGCWPLLLERAQARNIALEAVYGLPMEAPLLEAALPTEETRAADALSAEKPDVTAPLAVTEIDSRIRAGELKLTLMEYYPDEHPVLFMPHSGAPVHIPLAELDRQTSYGNRAAVYLPPCDPEKLERYGFDQLLWVMQRLRDPYDGCPWDREQTHLSLAQYLIEEAYEVLEAIEAEDPFRLADELGDVLLQVVFHAQVAQENEDFAIRDVTTAICRKMISRHTHIFGHDRADTAQQVVKNWEEIKRKEKGLTSHTQSLRDIPHHYPGLMRAAKVQKKALLAGQGCTNAEEELARLRRLAGELDPEDPAFTQKAGELLMSAANLCRLKEVQPELAIHRATEDYIEAFAAREECQTH